MDLTTLATIIDWLMLFFLAGGFVLVLLGCIWVTLHILDDIQATRRRRSHIAYRRRERIPTAIEFSDTRKVRRQ